jgi:enediyne biosynthesis protein E4
VKALVPLALAAAAAGAAVAQSPAPAAAGFKDVTTSAGIRFRHNSGAFGKKYLPETMGAGVAFADLDGDGWADLLFVNSKNWPGRPGARSLPGLYRNNKNGTFTDVTRGSGLDVEMYGLGVTAADYDGDGHTDVYLTGLGGNKLFRGLGGLKFQDVTAKAGVGGGGFGTSAAFFDYDKDGRPDLFVANYVEWSAEKDLFCTLDGTRKSYCTPESYKGQSPALYRNKGDGTFEDVTAKAGLRDPASKALGVAVLDYDGDEWPDLLVANDTQPNKLYKSNRNGTFTDVGTAAGVAFSEAGVARAGMGVDAADYDGSGRPSIVIGNFSNEMMALYHNEGTGLFIDEAPSTTLGQATLLSLTFSCFFFDYDLDGRLDIFGANGHVADDIQAVQARVSYAQPPHLFRNLGNKRFQAVEREMGPGFGKPMVGRGAAYADYDHDGDLDLAVTSNNGPARLLRNEVGSRNRWLRVRAVGAAAGRDGLGARVTVTTADGQRQWATVKTGSSYLSLSELPLTFGLGPQGSVKQVDVKWPGGRVDTVSAVAPGETLTVKEGEGRIKAAP